MPPIKPTKYAINIQELIDQLGLARFGHIPKVGDVFCGRGSIPFEAARIGCKAYGSDLNPVAALLTWSSNHLIGGGPDVHEKVSKAQQIAFNAVDKQISEWGVGHNHEGWKADAYLYCVEAICPSTGYLLPLASSWVISEKNKICAVLKADHKNKCYVIQIVHDANKITFNQAKLGTVQKGRMVCSETGESFSISSLRGDKKVESKTLYGLKLWENEDVVPKRNDVFQDRLYCVRWVEAYWDTNSKGEEGCWFLGVIRCADWNSRLCRWDSSPANKKVAQTFSNQALNTMYNFASRGLLAVDRSWFIRLPESEYTESGIIEISDARNVNHSNDIWITDPPYADAVNYHELTEFPLSWIERNITNIFDGWSSTNKSALAVKGSGNDFKHSMVDIYKNLTELMPDNGLQIVQFTHQDPAVWADLGMILWVSGLQVSAAWTIALKKV